MPEEISYSKGYSEIQMVNKRVDSELKNFYYYVITYIIEIFLLDKSKIAGLFSMFSGGFYGI